jgi:hypothetical protein
LPSHFWLPLLTLCFKHVLLASSFQAKEKKCREEKELSFKLSLYLLIFGSRFCPFVSNAFSWHLLLLKHKGKKKQRKKNHREEKNAEKGGNFPSSSHFALSFLALDFALPLLPFCFKRFLLTSFFSQA